ncbi:MAG: hypothetical protein LBG71_05825, partial [Clostridiales Family XIII bacterium]|nr:hypothetical protein [Clostridiales Family XIII bacterium]
EDRLSVILYCLVQTTFYHGFRSSVSLIFRSKTQNYFTPPHVRPFAEALAFLTAWREIFIFFRAFFVID